MLELHAACRVRCGAEVAHSWKHFGMCVHVRARACVCVCVCVYQRAHIVKIFISHALQVSCPNSILAQDLHRLHACSAGGGSHCSTQHTPGDDPKFGSNVGAVRLLAAVCNGFLRSCSRSGSLRRLMRCCTSRAIGMLRVPLYAVRTHPCQPTTHPHWQVGILGRGGGLDRQPRGVFEGVVETRYGDKIRASACGCGFERARSLVCYCAAHRCLCCHVTVAQALMCSSSWTQRRRCCPSGL